MKINLNSFFYSISDVLDITEKEILNITPNHSKRVAFIAVSLASELGYDEKRKFDLFIYSIMHDNGLVQSYQDSSYKKDFILNGDFKNHCMKSEENIKDFPFFHEHKDVLLCSHEAYDGSGYFKKSGNSIPLMSQLIFLAHCIDTNFDLSYITLEKKENIKTFIKQNEEKLFSSFLVRAFLQLSKKDIFWYELESSYIDKILDKILPKIVIDISYEKVIEIAKVFANIKDAKSNFTTTHTHEILEKIEILSKHYNLSYEKCSILKLVANFYDIGKLIIPNEIFEKEGKLNDAELFIVKKHASFTYFVLSNIEGLEEVCKIASAHHERLDGSGYPLGLKGESLSFENRLLAALDMYQALIEDRPQREAMSHKKAMKILQEQVKTNKLDEEIVDSIDEVFSN